MDVAASAGGSATRPSDGVLLFADGSRLVYSTADIDARVRAADEYFGEPQMPPDSVCNVPPDGLCWYHCFTAAEDAVGFGIGRISISTFDFGNIINLSIFLTSCVRNVMLKDVRVFLWKYV